jgi:hypothetical protein
VYVCPWAGGLWRGRPAGAALAGDGIRGGLRRHDEGAAAGRAGGAGHEPDVDAGGVEPVAARREHADLVPARELREADGALLRVRLAAGDLERHGGQRLPLEPLVLARRRLGVHGVGGGVAQPPEPRHEGQAHHAEQEAEHGRQDQERVRVDAAARRGSHGGGGGQVPHAG